MAVPFTTLSSLPMPLIRDNIDTDQIIPSREMKSTGKTGLADGLFAGWRYTAIGGRDTDSGFIMNRPEYADCKIILGGPNFGCGSSREHAVWALAEYGFRAVIAPSFAPIFSGNCVRNGILPAVLESEAVEKIARAGTPITIDLSKQSIILNDEHQWRFLIDDEAKTMLLGGLDAIDLSLKMRNEIAAFQQADRAKRPWIYLGATQ